MLNLWPCLFLLFLQEQGFSFTDVLKTWWPLLLGFFTFVVLVGSAVLVLLSKNREQIHTTDLQRADSADKLLKVRDTELAELEKKLADVKEELEAVAAEHGTLVGIDIELLFKFWARKDAMELEFAEMQMKCQRNEKLKEALEKEMIDLELEMRRQVKKCDGCQHCNPSQG